jgi:hypothetical protein
VTQPRSALSGCSKIRYRRLRSTLDEDGRQCPGQCNAKPTFVSRPSSVANYRSAPCRQSNSFCNTFLGKDLGDNIILRGTTGWITTRLFDFGSGASGAALVETSGFSGPACDGPMPSQTSSKRRIALAGNLGTRPFEHRPAGNPSQTLLKATVEFLFLAFSACSARRRTSA